jgi:hypothetical protein
MDPFKELLRELLVSFLNLSSLKRFIIKNFRLTLATAVEFAIILMIQRRFATKIFHFIAVLLRASSKMLHNQNCITKCFSSRLEQ